MATAIDTREEHRRRAWSEYVDALRDVHGAAYDDAEQEAWTRLQGTLGALDGYDPASSIPPVG